MQKKEIMIKLPNNEQSNDILKVVECKVDNKYAVVHVRRGDKVEGNWKEGIYHELDELLKIDAIKETRATRSTDAIHQISEMLHRRSMVMVFTKAL